MSITSASTFAARRIVRDTVPDEVRNQAERVAVDHLRLGGSTGGAISAAKTYARLHSVCHYGRTTPPETAA